MRAIVWTLRQRRYAGLAVAMLVLASACAFMGTFELHRYQDKRHDNDVLTANAHAAPVALAALGVPVTGQGPVPARRTVGYRQVIVTGQYLTGAQTYLGNAQHDGANGFEVVTPLRTGGGMLLVVRGFVAASAKGGVPTNVPAPPSGTVQVRAVLRPSESGNDSRTSTGEVTVINSGRQAARLGQPVFQAFATLTARQPGTRGLAAAPGPNLSNPSAGASEWQLLSYVVQWYVFGVLALLAPFLISRAEVREARRRFLGIDPDAAELDRELPPELTPAALPGRGGVRGALARRAAGTVAVAAPEPSERWQRAQRLADRYGRSLGPETELEVAARAGVLPSDGTTSVVRDSSAAVHRSVDSHHAEYNDYLWQLALADGGLPHVGTPPGAGVSAADAPAPRTIDADPEEK
jgi:cytochrome oxidase assembly protein ShyY1